MGIERTLSTEEEQTMWVLNATRQIVAIYAEGGRVTDIKVEGTMPQPDPINCGAKVRCSFK